MMITFGVNETRWLGPGWHERESGPGEMIYRYTSACAAMKLDPAWAGGRVGWVLTAPVNAVGRSMTLELRFKDRAPNAATASDRADEPDRPHGSSNAPRDMGDAGPADGQATRIVLADERWRLVWVTLPARLAPGAALEARITPVFVPDLVLRNGDHRQIGLRVAAFRIEMTGGAAGS